MDTPEPIPWDFDKPATWEPDLSRLLIQHLGTDYKGRLRQWSQNPDNYFGEEQFLLGLGDQKSVYLNLLKWVESRPMFAYHGSRLSEDQIQSVQTHGLRVLCLFDQIEIIQKRMKDYDGWSVSDRELAEKISKFRSGGNEGNREGRVSLLMSQNSLLQLHFVKEGSEFCSRIVCDLAGEQGRYHLKTKGIPVIFKVEVPATKVLIGFNPQSEILHHPVSEDHDFPPPLINLVGAHARSILNSGAAHYQNVGLEFSKDIPKEWIVKTLFPNI